MVNERWYDEWIARRRTIDPSSDLANRVMAALEGHSAQQDSYVRLAHRMNESRIVRWAACLASFLVGSLPFLLVAYAAELLVF